MPHTCHARDCQVLVPPELLMCAHHWGMVPHCIRSDVARQYRPGQCRDKRPSRKWMIAARRAILNVAVQEGRMTPAESERLLKRLKEELS